MVNLGIYEYYVYIVHKYVAKIGDIYVDGFVGTKNSFLQPNWFQKIVAYLLLPIIVEREAAGKYNLTYQMLRDFDVFFEKFPPTVRNRHAASE